MATVAESQPLTSKQVNVRGLLQVLGVAEVWKLSGNVTTSVVFRRVLASSEHNPSISRRIVRLTITSPFMHNEDVRRVQARLKLHNYLQGPVDGIFGPDTARAVKRAKYWLGYPIGEVNQIAG